MKTVDLTHSQSCRNRAEMPGMAFGRVSREPQTTHQFDSLVSTTPRRGRFTPVFAAVIMATVSISAAILLASLTGCSSESSQPAEPAKPEVKGPDLITGRSAFQKVYVTARGWQADAQPYRLEAIVTSDGNGHDGKWAMWRGSFASAAQRATKNWTWSGSAAQGAPERGVNPGNQDSYSPANSSTQVFDIAFLKVDSDQAFETAQKHGGDKILEKAPDTPVFYICDWNHNTNQLVWHVIYGASRDQAKLTVAVDASSGAFIRVEK
jgi:hypothetical protein